MGKSKKTSIKLSPRMTAEGRESQLVNLAMNLAKEKLESGTASSQLITHFLKLGTEKYSLENEKLRSDLAVANAKIKQMENDSVLSTLYENVIDAMKLYTGQQIEESYDDEY